MVHVSSVETWSVFLQVHDGFWFSGSRTPNCSRFKVLLMQRCVVVFLCRCVGTMLLFVKGKLDGATSHGGFNGGLRSTTLRWGLLMQRQSSGLLAVLLGSRWRRCGGSRFMFVARLVSGELYSSAVHGCKGVGAWITIWWFHGCNVDGSTRLCNGRFWSWGLVRGKKMMMWHVLIGQNF